MINHVFVANLERADNADFVEKSLSLLQKAMPLQKNSRVIQVLDGFSFPWHNHIPTAPDSIKHGLLRFITEIPVDTEGFETVVAFDAPVSETNQVNELAANWLIAYAESVTFVWDGNESTSEGLFVRTLLDKAIQARLTITLILPQTKQMLLLTGKIVTDVERSRLGLGFVSVDKLKSWFIPWIDEEWKANINELSSALAGIEGEDCNTQGHSWFAPIRKVLCLNVSRVKYKAQLNLWDRMAGYTEKLMFASIALDGDYWKKMKFMKSVSLDDGTYYGPFEGVYRLDNNKGTQHAIIQATNQVDQDFKKHDQNASLAANRQRSTYWWVAIFNIGAVVLSLLGAGLEWVLVLMGMGLARLAKELRWSNRWLNSRSLAETLRYTRMLMPLLATCQYQRQTLWYFKQAKVQAQQKDIWTVGSPQIWQARATVRSEGWPKDANHHIIYRPLDKLDDIRYYLVQSLQDQIDYHATNHKKQKKMVGHVGWLAFTLGGIATVLSLTQNLPDLKSDVISNVVTFLPALIGMFQGVLAQIEANRLSQQSGATMDYLNNQLALINSLQETDRWRYYTLLRTIATDSAEAMISENQGWNRLLSSR
jgi:hypothetical protein